MITDIEAIAACGARIAELKAAATADRKYMDDAETRIAELEAVAKTSICIFCGTTMAKDLNVMLAHAKECEKRPENRLMATIAELEADVVLADELTEVFESMWADVDEDHVGSGLYAQYSELMDRWAERVRT